MGMKSNSGLFTKTKGAIKNLLEKLMQQKKKKKKSESSIDENAEKMKNDYPYNEHGKFGIKGKNCRIIKSNSPVETSIDFYKRISEGGVMKKLKKGNGTMTILGDGSVITHRIITSTKGSPAVDINISHAKVITSQKIHFIKEEK